ncbi:MAG TPA: thiamine diphosphokinase [Tabrizicola sp.]|nr:thiamine diphosphokinase [Tabrizicola sp.]
MNRPIVQSLQGITLVGGGPFAGRDLSRCLARAPVPVAADSGADRLLGHGVMPEAVIGDFDSISDAARARIPLARQHVIAEQETTDFDKALRMVQAPFILALGFAGARLDHGLAAFNTLIRSRNQACILVGPKDICFAAPRRIVLELRAGDALSLFPLGPVTWRSKGLEWPVEGLDFAPDGRIGTSNRVMSGLVELEFDTPGMLVILPRRALDATIRSLCPG